MSFVLIVLLLGVFYWLFISSNSGSFTTIRPILTFETVLHSEFGYIIALIAKLAKSDGHISTLEIELIENILDDLCDEFSDFDQAREHLTLIFEEEKEIQDNVDHVAAGLYEKTANEPHKHHKILEFMVTLAFIDGELHPREKAVIFEVALAFHIQQSEVESLFSQFYNFYKERSSTHSRQSIDESVYYSLLGISAQFSKDELKKAYKKAVKEHHPDIIMGKGGSSEDIEKATEKLQDINEAYEYLKKQKGF